MPHIVKGVMPIHALPSKVSMLKRLGMRGRSNSTEIGQCRNSNLSQYWYMMGHPGGRVRMERRSTILTLLVRARGTGDHLAIGKPKMLSYPYTRYLSSGLGRDSLA